MLERRSVYFPISVGHPSLSRQVLSIAADLAVGDTLSAERRASSLVRSAAQTEWQHEQPGSGGRIAPYLRAQALARILIDLSNNSWSVAVEDGQVYLRAPSWGGTARMSVDDLKREKERSRQSLVARVQEQLERPTTRAFIAEQERLHFGNGASRSILSLIADGPALADSIRREGVTAVRPYLQVADADAGRDVHTGLKLWDVFRYFRYYWSFPYESTPGRTLPFLIRDAGQPAHPVCGLICIASPIPKLTARDSALGWSPAWLEAVVVALECTVENARERLCALVETVRHAQTETAVLASRVVEDVAALLGLPVTHDPCELARSIQRLGAKALTARTVQARKRLTSDIVSELESAIVAISTKGLGVTHKAAMSQPAKAREVLMHHAREARTDWLASRTIDKTTQRPRRATDDDLRSSTTLTGRGEDPLFRKKRASQLANLLAAWEDMQQLVESPSAENLRRHVLGSGARPEQFQFANGENVRRGVRAALAQRQSRFVASQVADVSVCGALPPYGPLLGGKLAALLALSRDLAVSYFERYNDQVSEIGSQMAGKQVRRPAELVALTTTSFYSVGSAQYNRVKLPPELGSGAWEFVGQSRGHGTIHFSRETSELLQSLVKAETGRELITSTFGEGPSERLRKIRDGLVRLELPGDEILKHGMPRLVFVAELGHGQTRPGATRATRAWRKAAPTAEDVAEFWRQRWLAPRLARSPELLEELRSFRRDEQLLSRRLQQRIHQQLDLLVPVQG